MKRWDLREKGPALRGLFDCAAVGTGAAEAATLPISVADVVPIRRRRPDLSGKAPQLLRENAHSPSESHGIWLGSVTIRGSTISACFWRLKTENSSAPGSTRPGLRPLAISMRRIISNPAR